MNFIVTEGNVRELVESKVGGSLIRDRVGKVYLAHMSDLHQRATVYFVVDDKCPRDYVEVVEYGYLRLFQDVQKQLNIRVILERDCMAKLPRDARIIREEHQFYV